MEPNLPLRERKKAATRRRIMGAALELFAERGFDGTTVEAIASAAEIAPRTFFRYFGAKVDLLFADHDDLVSLLRETLSERPNGEPVATAVRRANLAGVERMRQDPAMYLLRTRLVDGIPAAASRSRQLDADYEAVIAAAVAETRGADPATDLRSRLEGRALWSASRAARQVWLATEGTTDPAALIEEAYDLLEAGLGGNE